MSAFDFLTEAGEDIIKQQQAQIAQQDAAKQAAEQLSLEAAAAIREHILQQNLAIDDLQVTFNAAQGIVTLTGTAPDQETAEKAALAAGNIKGIAGVENTLTVVQAAVTQTRYHDVKSGETLSKIAKQYYGDANAYPKIFAANQPMLTSADKIYPGQKLRIPV